MFANIIATLVLVLCVAGAVTYLFRRHRLAKKTGHPACCGCSSKSCPNCK